MKKKELREKTNTVISDTKTALQTVFDALNQGQQKKLLADETVAALLARYGVG